MNLFSQPSLSEFTAAISSEGIGDFDYQVSPRSNAEWAAQLDLYTRAQEYFYGTIFNKRSGDGKDAPLLYPLKVNLVRMMCLTQASALWGQWEEDLIDFTCEAEKEAVLAKERAETALKIIQDTYQASGGFSLLFEGGLSQQIYGGTFLRCAVDPSKLHGVRFDKLMPYNVFCVWHPIEVDRILEAYIAIPIDKTEAALAYGIQIDRLPDEVIYLEHWREDRYEVSVGGHLLKDFHGKNPWGFVPIVYIPRVRAEGFYGMTLYEDIAGIQDELNTRLADMGDNINYASHPIRWIRNYRGDIRKLEMGADALWDLGETIGDNPEPEVGILQAQPEPSSSFNMINFLLDMTRQSAFTSPVAFGQDEGSQRSGVTLVLRLWPLLQQVKTTRIYWKAGLIRLHQMALKLVQYRDETAPEKLSQYQVKPDFAELVPQDRQLLIDEVKARAEQDLISPEEALAVLGVRKGSEQEELERIKKWLKFLSELKVKEVEAGKPDFNNQPNSGAASRPGSVRPQNNVRGSDK